MLRRKQNQWTNHNNQLIHQGNRTWWNSWSTSVIHVSLDSHTSCKASIFIILHLCSPNMFPKLRVMEKEFRQNCQLSGCWFLSSFEAHGRTKQQKSSTLAAIHSSPLKERMCQLIRSHLCVEGHSSTFSRLVQPDCGVDRFQYTSSSVVGFASIVLMVWQLRIKELQKDPFMCIMYALHDIFVFFSLHVLYVFCMWIIYIYNYRILIIIYIQYTHLCSKDVCYPWCIRKANTQAHFKQKNVLLRCSQSDWRGTPTFLAAGSVQKWSRLRKTW